MPFRCDRCGHCCREHRVPVTQADVRRLVRAGHAARDFVELVSPEEIDLTGEPETLAHLPGGPRLAVLAHRDGCVFLKHTAEGFTRCSVHESRPLSCRTYPFDRSEVPSAPLGLHPAPRCPEDTGLLSVLEPGPEHITYVESVGARDRELSEHASFVARFNRSQKMRRRLGKPRKTKDDFIGALVGEPWVQV